MASEFSEAELEACCGARRWAHLVSAAGPFISLVELATAADRAFEALAREDWLESFAAHASIGAARRGDAVGAREQAGVAGADEVTRAALADGNVAYRARFGFVFLIRAAGRSARELLDAMDERLANPPETEFTIAAGQQREITRRRLARLWAAREGETGGADGIGVEGLPS